MQFKVSRSELIGALKVTNKVIPNSVTTPILNNFLFNIAGNACEVCASNNEVFISKKITISENTETASITVPASRLIGLLNELPEQPLLFVFANEQVEIKSMSGVYVFPTIAGEDFPYFDIKNAPMFVTLAGADLLLAMHKTVFSVDPNVMNKTAGLCIDFDADGTTMTGASRALLSTRTVGKKNPTARRVVVPQKTGEVIAEIPACETVIIEVRDNNISFEMNDITVRSAVLNSQFVAWKSVIPTDNQNLVSVDRLMLLGAVKRAVQFTNKETIIQLTITAGNLSITGADTDFGQSAVENVLTQYAGEELTVGVNGDILKDILLNSEVEEMHFFIKDHKTVVLVRDDAKDTAVANLMLLMPFVK